MRMHVLRRTLLSAAVTATTIAVGAIAITPAHAATGSSAITGHLTDANGDPAAGASVTTQTRDASTIVSTVTGPDGSYVLPNLPAGNFVVNYRAAGSTFLQYAHQKLRFPRQTPSPWAREPRWWSTISSCRPAGSRATCSTGTARCPRRRSASYEAAVQNSVDSAGVQPDGAFAIDVPIGSYKLSFRVHNSFDQWYSGKLSWQTPRRSP